MVSYAWSFGPQPASTIHCSANEKYRAAWVDGGKLIGFGTLKWLFQSLPVRLAVGVGLVAHFSGTLPKAISSLNINSNLSSLERSGVVVQAASSERNPNQRGRPAEQFVQQNDGKSSGKSWKDWQNFLKPLRSNKESNRPTENSQVSAELCLPMGETERRKVAQESGLDLVGFLETTTSEMHSALAAEEKFKILARRFDHLSWSRALLISAKKHDSERNLGARDLAALYPGVVTKEGDVALQANLAHATSFLNDYNAMIAMARRQELSALRAFDWDEEIRAEIFKIPTKVLVQSYLTYSCDKSDARRYGCAPGETLYRFKTLLAPRLACRFPEKQAQYQVHYWVRIRSGRPTIFEVEARHERLVTKTIHENSKSQFAAFFKPNLNETIPKAGLQPFHAVMIWREASQIGNSEARPEFHFIDKAAKQNERDPASRNRDAP